MPNAALLAALQKFARDVSAKLRASTTGEPEDQLRSPFEVFMREAGQAPDFDVGCVGEILLPGRLGKPDYTVLNQNLLMGYAELKAPNTGADTERFAGHNAEQARRFATIPNLLYTDGNEWALYRSGELAGGIVRLTTRVNAERQNALTGADADAIMPILADFLSWRPIVPDSIESLSALLAPLCRMLRDSVAEPFDRLGAFS